MLMYIDLLAALDCCSVCGMAIWNLIFFYHDVDDDNDDDDNNDEDDDDNDGAGCGCADDDDDDVGGIGDRGAEVWYN